MRTTRTSRRSTRRSWTTKISRASRTKTRTTRRTTTSKTETPFALSLGGNIGETRLLLTSSLDRLRALLGPLRIASLYRTAAHGPAGQPDFYNTAATGTTRLEPDQVLAAAKALELAAGRRRGPRLGPRPLDIDLLLFGDRVSGLPELSLPHPRLAERRFVLVPLAEIAPDWRVPPEGRTVRELLARTADTARVERVAWEVVGL